MGLALSSVKHAEPPPMEKEMAAEAAQNLRTVPDTFGLKFSCARLSKLAVHDKKKGDCWQTTLWYSIMLNDERPTMFSSHAIGLVLCCCNNALTTIMIGIFLQMLTCHRFSFFVIDILHCESRCYI